MLNSFVFGLFLLRGGRQMNVEHCRKQCFMLLTASSGCIEVVETSWWLGTDQSDRSDWTFQYKNEDESCDDYKWYDDVDDDNRAN